MEHAAAPRPGDATPKHLPRRKEHAQKQICVRTVTAVVFLISHCPSSETQQSVADSGPALGSALMRSGQRHEPAEQKS